MQPIQYTKLDNTAYSWILSFRSCPDRHAVLQVFQIPASHWPEPTQVWVGAIDRNISATAAWLRTLSSLKGIVRAGVRILEYNTRLVIPKNFLTVEFQENALHATLKCQYESHFPLKTRRKWDTNQPWITPKMKRLINKKRHAHNHGNLERYGNQNYCLKGTIKQAKKEYFEKLQSEREQQNWLNIIESQ